MSSNKDLNALRIAHLQAETLKHLKSSFAGPTHVILGECHILSNQDIDLSVQARTEALRHMLESRASKERLVCHEIPTTKQRQKLK